MRKPSPPPARPRPRPPVQVARPEPRPIPPPAPPPEKASGPWLWGRHAVLAALGNPDRKLLRLVATEEAATEIAALPPDETRPVPQILSRADLDRLLPPGSVHQGLALLAKTLRYPALEDLIERLGDDDVAVILALDQVTDPHNVGAILRSAAAFGALAVLVPERNAPEASGALAKAASGALEHVPLIRVVNLNRSLDQLKKSGFWTVGLDGDAEKTLAGLRLGGRIVLVLGSEGDGLRRLTREACDLMARLPTHGPIASLNVSNAAAIALYEMVRAR